jgi:preprotein translocase subunit SecA
LSGRNKISSSIILGQYPEKPKPEETIETRFKRKLNSAFIVFNSTSAKPYQAFVQQVFAFDTHYESFSTTQITQRLIELRALLSMHGTTDPLLAELFAIIGFTCMSELGHKPYHTQILAARIMLDEKLAEMATGEGKTLSIGIGAAAAALAGIPVHVITANDYLVARDAETLEPVFKALGLTVGTIVQSSEVEARKQAYQCNICYITAKELAFDYLRDCTMNGLQRSHLHQRVASLSGQTQNTLLRGLHMAIIDEADSILIDEARVPLILSQSVLQDTQIEYYQHILQLAKTLVVHQDFMLNQQSLSAKLTDAGWQLMQKFMQQSIQTNQLHHNKLYVEETLCQALAALYLFQKDKHYLVRDDAVHIVDEITGRISPGRVWSRGLHQLIELKEHCKPSGETITAGQITFQRFFPRYLKLGGMSGTLSESRAELLTLYALNIIKVPLRLLSKRIILPTCIYRDRNTLWQEVTKRVIALNKNGHPILIGTDSVADSEVLSQHLMQAGLAHEVLNARQDQREANIVALAGQCGQITVSTNIAGRGTDISLGAGAAELGGIHLISCQLNTSRRIDRQLIGRCARQGSPGTAQTLISFDKPLMADFYPHWMRILAGSACFSKPQWLVKWLAKIPQLLEESRQRRQRQQMMEHDTKMERQTSILE